MKYLFLILSVVLVFNLTYTAAQGKENTMTVQNGKEVEFDYKLIVDGKLVDSSEGQKPLRYVHGEGHVIPGLLKGLQGMRVGEEKNITVMPEEAYGAVKPNGFKEVPRSSLPSNIDLKENMLLQVKDPAGRAGVVRIKEIKKDTVLVDFNHPLAGKTLNFEVKVVSIK